VLTLSTISQKKKGPKKKNTTISNGLNHNGDSNLKEICGTNFFPADHADHRGKFGNGTAPCTADAFGVKVNAASN
jgi:hypothetical protein